MNKTTFSDSWHLVSDKHACLLPSVETHKQYFRGERWYILKAPFKNEFFRLTESTYFFIARMTMGQTIDEVWRVSMERDPDECPGQEEVIEILGQLNNANLIHSDIAADSHQLHKAQQKRQHKLIKMQLMNFLFLKLPLFNPDRFLEFIKPYGKVFINPLALIIWLGTVFWGLKAVFENFSAATSQASGFLSPDNLPWILAVTVILKAIHELAHGISCKHYGGYVPTVGVMLILFAPLPYIDATSSWGFRNRLRRISVSFAGIYAELFIAAIAALIWAETGRGPINAVAYNTMLIASLTTLLFNLNPLLKFDGYYIFSDLFGLPNLQQRANKFLQFFMEYVFFGYKESINPARSTSEWFWLGGYGIGAAIYRAFLMISISMILAENFFEIGLVLALFTLINYVIVPLFKFTHYLITNKAIARHRVRAWICVACFVSVVITLLGIIPFPEHFQEPGVVWSKDRQTLHAESSGRIVNIHVESSEWVQAGTLLATLENTELNYQIKEATLAVKQAKARFKMADASTPSSLAPLLKMIELEQVKLKRLQEQKEKLFIRAPQDGVWIAPELQSLHGQWVERGTEMGSIGNPEDYQFITVISQKEAANLFNRKIEKVEIRLWGEAKQKIPATIEKIIPAEQKDLPSAALGWFGGGQVEVNQQDPEGKRAVESFFQIIANILPEHSATLREERSGKMRFTIGERPLLFQWYHDIRTVIQKRLRI